jgi:hypothetical protein
MGRGRRPARRTNRQRMETRADVCGEAPCLLFSTCATSIWKFANGAELLLFLEASPPFEFYICDAQATYLLCCNDHDFVIGWGRSVEWVRQLKTS